MEFVFTKDAKASAEASVLSGGAQIQAWHVREAFRRLTQLPRGPMSSGWGGEKIDGRHQRCEAGPPIIAL